MTEPIQSRADVKSRENEWRDLVAMWRRFHLSLWAPLAAYLVFLIWINPFFEYVIGDDWIYSLSSYDLAVHHILKIPDPSVASLLWQAVWGYLFTLPFGFSFSALHLSTIVIFVIGVYFWYRTLRLCVRRELYVFVGTFMLIAVPQIPILSITFNTDIHALSYLLISLYFYLLYLKDRRWTILAAGAVASSLGILVRQTIILMPFILWLTLWWTRGMFVREENEESSSGESQAGAADGTGRRQHRILRIFFHVLPLAVLCGLYAWIEWVHGLPFVWRYQHLELFNFNRIFHEILVDPIYTLHYSVLFILPVIVALLLSRDFYSKLSSLLRSPLGRWMIGGAIAVITGLTLFLAYGRGEWMPYLQGDSYLLAYAIPLRWKWITGFTALGAALIGLLLLPALAQMLLSLQQYVLSSAVGKILVKRWVRRSIELVLFLAAVVVALGWARIVIIGIGNAVVERLYHTIGGIGGAHGYPIEFWKAQVAELYKEFRWIGSGLLLGCVPIVSFLAGNLKIASILENVCRVELHSAATHRGELRPTHGISTRSVSAYQLMEIYLALYVVFTVIYMIITGLRFDRYLIVFFPAIALLVILQISRLRISRTILIAAVCGWMILSGLNARSIMAPQAVTWKAYLDLRSEGISAEKIDAGLYVSNWFNYKPERYRRISLKERWWIDDPEYFLSRFGKPGYHIIKAYPYDNPYTGMEYMYVLKRDAPSAGKGN